jgi:hypothetical protein
LKDDKALALRKYGENPNTKDVIKEYKIIDRLKQIPYDTTAEDMLRYATYANNYFNDLLNMDLVVAPTEIISLFEHDEGDRPQQLMVSYLNITNVKQTINLM